MIVAAAVVIATSIALRIVSLAPALTEDLFAIGAGPAVVGVDDYSDRPAAARSIPRVGSLRTINSEAIAGLNPDLVVGIPYQAPNLRDIARLGVHTQTLASDTLADDFAAIATLGRATGHAGDAARLLAAIRRRLDAARRATRTLEAPRALAVIGVAPIYTAGHGSYIDDLFTIAHIRNAAGDVHAAFPALSAETVEAQDPDVLVVPRGTAIPNEPPWSRLRAVRSGHIVTIDEDDFLRPGPRVAEVVDALVAGIACYRSAEAAPNAIEPVEEREAVRATAAGPARPRTPAPNRRVRGARRSGSNTRG